MLVSDYIYYRQENFLKNRESDLGSLLSTVKSQIVDNAIVAHENRINALVKNTKSSYSSKQLSDFLRNEDYLKELNKENNVVKNAAHSTFPETYEAAMKLYQEIGKEITDIKTFNQQLGKFLNTVDKNYENIRDGYYQKIKQDFIQRRNEGKSEKSGNLTLEEEIFSTLMDSKKSSFFSFNDIDGINSQRVDTNLGKLYTLKGILGESGISSKDQDFWKDVAKKTKSWIYGFSALMEEVAVFEAYVEGNSKFFTTLREMFNPKESKITGGTTSPVNFSKRFKEDPALIKFFQDLQSHREGKGAKDSKNVWNIEKNKTNVSDVSMVIKENAVSGSIGISVKQYKTQNINDPTKSFHFTTRSGTSLLTFLLRECNFSTSDFITFLNLGASRPKRKNDKTDRNLESKWNLLREQVTYRGMFAILAGLEDTSDQVFYMSLNGKIFSISSILRLIKQNMESGRSPARLEITGDGFNRTRYKEINWANYERKKSLSRDEAAIRRSNATRIELMDILQATKIKTSLSLYGLSNLLK